MKSVWTVFLTVILASACADDESAPPAAAAGDAVESSATDTTAIGGRTERLDSPSNRGNQAPGPPAMQLEVDLDARELYVYRDGERVETHPVAVGSEEWPTPTREWTIGEVVWNPRWVPPEEEWAEDEEIREPGDPENPLSGTTGLQAA